MDHVLGGGLVAGSLVLFAGEPGVGKSTFLLQAANFVAETNSKVLYVSGEESEHQIKLRAERLNLSGTNVFMLAETEVDSIIQHLDNLNPCLAIIDSIQTLFTHESQSGPGSTVQVKDSTLQLMRWAKSSGTPILLAGHVTKEGSVAGPRVLEHMVDVVLYLEGENLGSHRLLRSVKNRFGSTNEIALFEMTKDGLKEVADPSSVLLNERSEGAIGSAISPVIEGSRALLLEIQALTSPSVLPMPRRTTNGVDYNRMIMIAAILGRRANLSLATQDIIVNVAGGMRLSEPGGDLALGLAIASSLHNQPVENSMVAIGEIGLNGELRSVPQLEQRIREASRMGFSFCLIPDSTRNKTPNIPGITPIYAKNINQAIKKAIGYNPGYVGSEQNNL
jgi:DNA repair protein RadA/Sms